MPAPAQSGLRKTQRRRPVRSPAGKPEASRALAVGVTIALVAVWIFAARLTSAASTPRSTAHHGPAVTPAAAGSPAPLSPTGLAAPGTSTSAVPTQTVGLPPPGASLLTQTAAEPSADTEVFRQEMSTLWQAVQSGDPAVAAPVFFPETAYLQLKALRNDAADYTNRLVPHLGLDIIAAHHLLGPGAGDARLLQTLVPAAAAAWIPPGACANKLGYWHVAGSRVVYEEGGQERSFGIASLISWQGYWYLIHLGSVRPPSGRGTTDGASAGIGIYGARGGC